MGVSKHHEFMLISVIREHFRRNAQKNNIPVYSFSKKIQSPLKKKIFKSNIFWCTFYEVFLQSEIRKNSGFLTPILTYFEKKIYNFGRDFFFTFLPRKYEVPNTRLKIIKMLQYFALLPSQKYMSNLVFSEKTNRDILSSHV
jgi:hypothetical protein